jgi:hypothetical protein
MKFGDIVEVTEVLRRKCRGSDSMYCKYKYWHPVKIAPKKGIFIGTRTLSDGTREWDSEAGYYFIPKEHFPAALVVFNEKENPEYVRLFSTADEETIKVVYP